MPDRGLPQIPQTLNEIIANRALWADFGAYMKNILAHENFDFMEAYYNNLDPQKMYWNFIVPGSKSMLNISSDQRTNIRDMMESDQVFSYKDLFGAAYNAVYLLVENNFLTAFKSDPANCPRYLADQYAGTIVENFGIDATTVDPINSKALQDISIALHMAYSTPDPDGTASAAEIRKFEERQKKLAKALTGFKQEFGLTASTTDIIADLDGKFSGEWIEAENFRRAMGIPDEAAEDFLNFYTTTMQPPADDSDEAKQARKKAIEEAGFAVAENLGLGADAFEQMTDKVVATVGLINSLRDTREKQALVDARKAEIKSHVKPTKDEKAAYDREIRDLQLDTETAALKARDILQKAGIDDAAADKFVKGFAKGAGNFSRDLFPSPPPADQRSHDEVEAFDSTYSADVDIPEMALNFRPDRTEIQAILDNFFTSKSFLQAKKAYNAPRKDGQELGAYFANRNKIMDALVTAANKALASAGSDHEIDSVVVDGLLKARAPDAPPRPTPDADVSAQPEAATQNGGNGLPADFWNDSSFRSLKTDYDSAAADQKDRLIGECLQIAQAWAKRINFTGTVTRADVVQFLDPGRATATAVQPEAGAQNGGNGLPADFWNDSSFRNLKTDYDKAAADQKDRLIGECLQIAQAWAKRINFTGPLTREDVVRFLDPGRATPTPAPDPQPTAAPTGVLAEVLALPRMAELRNGFRAATTHDEQKPFVTQALSFANSQGKLKDPDFSINPIDVMQFFNAGGEAAPARADTVELSDISELDALRKPFAEAANQNERKAILAEAIKIAKEYEKKTGVVFSSREIAEFISMDAEAFEKRSKEFAKPERRDAGTSDFDRMMQTEQANYELLVAHPKMRKVQRDIAAASIQSIRDMLVDGAVNQAPEIMRELGLDFEFDPSTLADYLYPDPQYGTAPTPQMSPDEQRAAFFSHPNLMALKKKYAAATTQTKRDDIYQRALGTAADILDAWDDRYDEREQHEKAETGGPRQVLQRITQQDVAAFLNDGAPALADDGNDGDGPGDQGPGSGPGDQGNDDDTPGTPGAGTGGDDGSDTPPDPKVLLGEIIAHLKAKELEQAKEKALDLELAAGLSGGPLAGKSAADILKIAIAKVKTDGRYQPAEERIPVDPTETRAAPPNVASSAEIPRADGKDGKIPMAVLTKFKWAKFIKLYQIKLGKMPQKDFEEIVRPLARMILKKQDDVKQAYKQGLETYEGMKQKKVQTSKIKDHKHLCGALKLALLEWYEDGALTNRLNLQGAKEVVKEGELVE